MVVDFQRHAPFAGVLALPVLVDCRGHFDQPGTVFGVFQKVRRGKKLDGIGRRVPQRLEQAGVNQGGDVMGLAIQHPPRLLRRQAGRKLTEERQKPILIVFHTPYQSPPA